MAAITSYATLQTEVAGWLHRDGDDELDDAIPGLIQNAEFRIYRDLRVRQMETAFSTAIASGVIAIPTGYQELKLAYVASSPVRKLERKDAEWIYLNYPTRSSDGAPKFIARQGTNFIFGPYPDSTYTVSGTYYQKLTALSDANTSNWLITDAPDLILAASLYEAAEWTQDEERIARWERKYTLIKDRVQRNDEQEEFSGSPLAATVR